MKHLLLLTPLLLTAGAIPTAAAQDIVVSGEKQAPVEETRAVTLDVTGMT